MANNRLFLLDTEENEYVTLAKGFGDGWSVRVSAEVLAEFIESGVRDFAASDTGPSALRICTEADLPAGARPWEPPT
jgi:hypothetical protein